MENGSFDYQDNKYCTKCGAQMKLSDVFCPKCGNRTMESENEGYVPETYHEGFWWSPGRIIALVSIILTIVASFFPFLTISVLGSTVSATLWSKNFIGLTIIGLVFLLVAILELVRDSEKLSKDMIAVGIVFVVEIIFQYMFNVGRLKDVDTGFGNYDFSGMLTPGVGFYILILTSIGMIISGFVIKHDNENV